MGTQAIAIDPKIERMLEKIPDVVIIREAKKRTADLKAKRGKYATMKKWRICKGCGKEFSAREMRAHECKVAIADR